MAVRVIEWKVEALRAEAKLDGGKAAEVVLTRFSGATGNHVTKNSIYGLSVRWRSGS
jgi:hypothetical protein